MVAFSPPRVLYRNSLTPPIIYKPHMCTSFFPNLRPNSLVMMLLLSQKQSQSRKQSLNLNLSLNRRLRRQLRQKSLPRQRRQ